MVVPAQGSCAHPVGTCQALSCRQSGPSLAGAGWGDAGAAGPDMGRCWRNKGCHSLTKLLVRSPFPSPHGTHVASDQPQGTCRWAEAVQGVSPRGPHRAGTRPPSSCWHQQPAAGRPAGGAPRVTAACRGTDPREDPSVPGVGLSNSYICAVIPFLFFKIVFNYFRPALY